MGKLKNIEFLRVFFISSIVMLHMFIDRKWCLCTLFPDITFYQTIKSAIAYSNNCVEGFFIIAGFLLVYTFKANTGLKDFILKKYIRLSPVILFSMGLCAIGWLLGVMHFKLIPNLLTVLLVNQFGIKFVCGQNPILWYTSVLFAGLLLYFCIIKYLSPKIKTVIITILIILSYGIIEILQHGSFANPLKNYYHVFNIGFLRAVGGIGVGCLLGLLYKRAYPLLENKKEKFGIKIFYTLLEIILTLFVFWWCLFIHSKINNIFIVMVFAILIMVYVLNKGYLSQYLNKDIWTIFGRYQYSVYVVHYVIIRIFGLALWKINSDFVYMHPFLPIVIMLGVILFVGFLTYHMIELPCAKFLKDKLIRKQN